MHEAAIFGKLAMSKIIIEKLEDKNPRSRNEITPLQYAAHYGHFEICQLIIKNIEVVYTY